MLILIISNTKIKMEKTIDTILTMMDDDDDQNVIYGIRSGLSYLYSLPKEERENAYQRLSVMKERIEERLMLEDKKQQYSVVRSSVALGKMLRFIEQYKRQQEELEKKKVKEKIDIKLKDW